MKTGAMSGKVLLAMAVSWALAMAGRVAAQTTTGDERLAGHAVIPSERSEPKDLQVRGLTQRQISRSRSG